MGDKNLPDVCSGQVSLPDDVVNIATTSMTVKRRLQLERIEAAAREFIRLRELHAEAVFAGASYCKETDAAQWDAYNELKSALAAKEE